MGKKLTRKEKVALQKKENENSNADIPKKNKLKNEPQRNLFFIMAVLIAATGFVFYFNTLQHGYALDDYSIILENTQTRRGTEAIGEIFSSSYRSGYFTSDNELYRPLSKAFFAWQWQHWPKNPAPGHFFNVLFYCISGVLLFFAMFHLTGSKLFSFVTSVLFVAHPIHTEVVANIKSLDEIFSFLFFSLMLLCIVVYLKKQHIVYAALGACSYFLSLLSKESAITYIAVIPLLLFVFTNENKTKIIKVTLIHLLPVVLFLLIRAGVLDASQSGPVSVADNILSGQPFGSRIATAIAIMGLYLQKLIFPHPLVSDYSFRQLEIVSFTSFSFIFSFLIYSALGIFAIFKLKEKSKWVVPIFFFFITASVASNVVMLIGTSFAERMMYAPSLAICMAVAIALQKLFTEQDTVSISDFIKTNIKAIGITATVVLLFGFKTVSRNRAWENNYTLYSTDVTLSPKSTRTHYYLGNHITQDEFLDTVSNEKRKQEYIQQAIQELRTSIELYYYFSDAHQQLARTYLRIKQYDSALVYFNKALAINPTNPLYYNNYGNALYNTGKLMEAKEAFEKAVQYNPGYAHAYNNLGSIYGTLGETAKQSNKPDEARTYFEQAIHYFKTAVEKDPEYSSSYYFLGITYRQLGDEKNATYYIQQSEQVKAKFNK